MALKIRNSSNEWTTAKNIFLWNGVQWAPVKTSRVWNGVQWITFFNSVNSISLPPSIETSIGQTVWGGPYGVAFSSSVIIDVNTNGNLIITGITGDGNGDFVQNYTWRLSGSSDEYEVQMENPYSPPHNGDWGWTTGQQYCDPDPLSENEEPLWIGLGTSVTWGFSLSVAVTGPAPVNAEVYNGTLIPYNLKSNISIRRFNDNSTKVSCPIDITLTLPPIP